MKAIEHAVVLLHRITLAAHRFVRRRLERSTDRLERCIQRRRDELDEYDERRRQQHESDVQRIADVRRYMAEHPVEGP